MIGGEAHIVHVNYRPLMSAYGKNVVDITIVKSARRANHFDHPTVECMPGPFSGIASAVDRGAVEAGQFIEPGSPTDIDEHGVTPVTEMPTGPTADVALARYGASGERNSGPVAAFPRVTKATTKAARKARNRASVKSAIQEATELDAKPTSLMNLPSFHSTPAPSRLPRVPDPMVESGLLDVTFGADATARWSAS